MDYEHKDNKTLQRVQKPIAVRVASGAGKRRPVMSKG